MGFWDNVHGNSVPAAPVQQQAPSPAWFVPQTTTPQQQAQVAQQYQQTPPVEEISQRALQTQTKNNAQGSCPSCGSGNYAKPSPNASARCFDCGYNDRGLQHSTQGMGSIPTEGPTRAAKQVAGSGGFNPQQIIGRVE